MDSRSSISVRKEKNSAQIISYDSCMLLPTYICSALQPTFVPHFSSHPFITNSNIHYASEPWLANYYASILCSHAIACLHSCTFPIPCCHIRSMHSTHLRPFHIKLHFLLCVHVRFMIITPNQEMGGCLLIPLCMPFSSNSKRLQLMHTYIAPLALCMHFMHVSCSFSVLEYLTLIPITLKWLKY